MTKIVEDISYDGATIQIIENSDSDDILLIWIENVVVVFSGGASMYEEGGIYFVGETRNPDLINSFVNGKIRTYDFREEVSKEWKIYLEEHKEKNNESTVE